MATIDKLICNLKDEMSKWFYQKGDVDSRLEDKSDVGHVHDDRYYTESEVDTKLNTKANTTVASTSANGLMSSNDKVKLDGVEEGANNVTVDSSMSSSSTNPVQNKVVNAQLTSLNNNKANISHTHNDNSGVIEVDCSYGDVYKFKKNGWVVVVWQNLDLTNANTGSWTTLAQTGWSNTLASVNFYGNFTHTKAGTAAFIVSPAGNLRVTKNTGADNTGHYGYIIYPTED